MDIAVFRLGMCTIIQASQREWKNDPCKFSHQASTASKIHDTGIKECANPTTAPGPCDNHWVDEAGHEEGEHCVGRTLYSLGNSAAHNGGSGSAEGPLKKPAQHLALAAACIVILAINWCNVSSAAIVGVHVEAKESMPSDETVGWGRAIGESPTKAPPTQGPCTHVHQVLHQHVGSILGPAASRLQHGKARMPGDFGRTSEQRSQQPQ